MNITNHMNRRLTPRNLRTGLVLDWFPGNSEVQQLFFQADVRTFLNTFNSLLPTEHLRVVSVEMLFMKVSNNIIGTLILTSG